MSPAFSAVARDVVVYTRAGCHLCDEAVAQLQAHALIPKLIDIDGDDALRAAHNDWVPVVEIDGRIRFRGRIDLVLLRRILQNDDSHGGNSS